MFRLITSAFIGIGSVFVAIGVYLYHDTAQFTDNAVRVDGTVVELTRGNRVFYPVVQYTDHLGKERKLYSGSGTFPPNHYVGEEVTVLIDPTDPNFPLSAEIETNFHVWGAPVFLVAFGGFFILLAGGMRYIDSRGGTLEFGSKRG